MNIGTQLRRTFALLLTAALLAALSAPALAQGSGKIVRVGWFDSMFNATDEQDRRSGYAYEYQQKVAAYTGWTYEYVEGSWPELLEMLEEGKIDLLSDVSYTEERGEKMFFSAFPMGTEAYYLFAVAGNTEITAEDFSTINGKRVGVNRGSVQKDLFEKWASSNGVEAELVELSGREEDHFTMLRRGQIDLYLTLDAFGIEAHMQPVCAIGDSDFYFALSRGKPELLQELNSAMNRIQEESRYYTEKLSDKYFKRSASNRYLTPEEQSWLEEHGPIRVGYQDNYLAFCAQDPKTGELTGALKEYLSVASWVLENAQPKFEAIAYPTSAAAMEAMKKGEVDCVFPANLTDYDGEVQGFFMTPALMKTDMAAVVRAAEKDSFHRKERVTVAVNVGNPNYDIFLREHFPDWRSIYFKDTPECLAAVAEGKADCLLISNYRYNNIAMLCEKYKLDTVSTGVEMEYYLAVNRSDTVLYSILAKLIGLVPDATVDSALSHYFTRDAKTSVLDLLRQNRLLVCCVVGAVVLLVGYLAVRALSAERRAREKSALIDATEFDSLTGLYAKNYFYEHLFRLFRENPQRQMDVVVLNIENFRGINNVSSRDFGNRLLRALGEELRAWLKENGGGIAGRGSADRFALCCAHLDRPKELFDRLQGRLSGVMPGADVQLRMGVMPWREELEPRRMVELANAACTMAKGRFKEHLVVCADKVWEKMKREQRLVKELRRALDCRELEVFYQGVYDLSTQPPRLVSAEALVRWNHPELGLLESNEFTELFERTGQISEVDRYVWTDAAHQVFTWKHKLGITLPVSVNLSRVDLFGVDLADSLAQLMKDNELDCGDFRLEVTESVCNENFYRAIDIVNELRERGFRVELDDFGVDEASLHLLSNLHLDALKLDRSLVSDLLHRESALRRTQLILGAAKSLNIPVVAEGVENEAQLERLRALGCCLAQGWYFTSPLSPAEFEEKVLNIF